MLKSFRITVDGFMADALTKRQRAAIDGWKRDALWLIASQWHRLYYEGHFTAEGARKYHYGSRATKEVTTGQIRRRKGVGAPRAPDARPLYWSGRSYARGKQFKIHATHQMSRLIMPVNALNIQPRGNPKLRMREELTKVLPSELRELGKIASKSLEGRLNQKGIKATVEIR